MDTKAILQQFEEAANRYLTDLDHYSAEQFSRKPAPDHWSLGQMYNHLLKTGFSMQLQAIETCRTEETSVGGAKKDMGKKIFAAGQFPPIQIKLPKSTEHTPPAPESTEEVKQRLLLLIEKVKEVETQLDQIDPERKVAHPRLGYLNALEWFQLIAMHFSHHLRQKERLDQFIGA